MKFSKENVKNEIMNIIIYLEKEYHFTTHDGFNQVKDKGEYINRLYGKYEGLLLLHEILFGYIHYTVIS